METNKPAELIERPRSLLIAATVIAVTTTLFAGRMPAAMENFRSMFQAMGIAPSRNAELVFSLRHIWWLFALASIALLVWIARRSRITAADKVNMKVALIATVAVTALMYAFAAFAIYTPLFKLGATV
jgi:glucan phosphoethanolaminetransferase (alkaline phosphatase superfamily)